MNNDNYEDIINLPHYEPKHKRMSMSVRSAQFAPFSALTGFNDEVKETERLVDKKVLLDEDEKIKINNKLLEILKNIKDKPQIKITYFIKDERKKGGKYITIIDNVKKINMIDKYIMLESKTKIHFKDIFDIEVYN